MASTTQFTRDFVEFSRISQAYQGVLFGIVVWDWLVCLRSEYKHIWRSESSLSKWLYIVTRYLCIALTIAVFSLHFVQKTLNECNVLVRVNCAALTLIQMMSMAVLGQRAYILSSRSKTVLALLLAGLAATLSLGVLHASHAVEADKDAIVGERGYCHVMTKPGWSAVSAIFFAVPIIVNTAATALVVLRAYKLLPKNTGLRNLLISDGLLFLIGIDSIGLLQLIFFLETLNHMLMMLNAAALLALTSVFCCRFILHIREKSSGATEIRNSRMAEVDWSNNFKSPLDGPETVSRSTRSTSSRNNGTSSFISRLTSGRRRPSAGTTLVGAEGTVSHISIDGKPVPLIKLDLESYDPKSSSRDAPGGAYYVPAPQQPRPAYQRAQRSCDGVMVSQVVQHQVEEMTDSELDWEKEHPTSDLPTLHRLHD